MSTLPFDGHAAPTTNIIQSARYTYLFDYLGGTNFIYMGQARPGNLTSDPAWLIRKFAYDGNNNILSIQIANGFDDDIKSFNAIWDNRATLSYS